MITNLHLAAYQTDLAHNLGSMIRIAACFGVVLDIVEPCGFPLSQKSLREASLDYGEKCETNLHSDWSQFKIASKDRRLVLLSTKAPQSLWQFKIKENDTLIMGRETSGVPQEVHNQCHSAIHIPMPGGCRSLNVAICAGVVVCEALRQLQSK